MALGHGASIVRSGLVMHLDAANTKSYPGTGTTWTDLSGNSNNGILLNGVGYSSDYKGAMTFDGSDDQVSVSNNTSLQNTFSTNSFSITSVSKTINLIYPRSAFPFWLQSYVLNGTWAINNQGLSSGDGSNESSFNIEVNNGGTYFLASVNHTTVLEVPYMRTFVFDRSNGFTFKYYVNGVFLGEATNTNITGSIYTSGGFVFGNMWGWAFNGSLYNLMIHSKELSAVEIKQNFEALRGRYGI
jgi:hypothetical protein